MSAVLQNFDSEAEVSPPSFIIPEQYEEFAEEAAKTKGEAFWIVKPSAGARGNGIYVTDKATDIYKGDSCVVS